MRGHLTDYLDSGMKDHVRGLRILLEYFYASEQFERFKSAKTPTVSVFGSARTHPGDAEYNRARELGKKLYQAGYAVVTGASRGIMQAANQGVAEGIAKGLVTQKVARSQEAAFKTHQYKRLLKNYSLGLSISLPFEESKNPYVGISATFHYFMIRKFFFATLSQAFVACEGGWGTRDELYEMLTLIQTGKTALMPIIYLSPDPQHLKHDLTHTVKRGYIDKKDLKLIDLVRTPEQAVKIITHFYRNIRHTSVKRDGVWLWFHQAPSSAFKTQVEKAVKRLLPVTQEKRWGRTSLHLIGFRSLSYGVVREVIDKINAL